MEELKKEISFDGINFRYRDLPIGTISNRFRFKSPIPKDVMDEEKDKVLGRILRENKR